MAVVLAVVNVMAALDVTDVVGAYLTVVADMEDVAMTLAEVVTAYQDQLLSDLKTVLTKTPLIA